MGPSPEAPKQVLLRRASLDLTGLPPTPEETAAFEADTERGRPAVIPDEFAASVRGWIDEDLEQLKALDSLVVGDLSDHGP